MSEVVVHETRAQYWADRINAAWQKSVESIIQTGKLIGEALSEVTQQELAPRLCFSQQTISKLKLIAEDPRIYAHGRNLLPASWRTLYELTKLDDDSWARIGQLLGKAPGSGNSEETPHAEFIHFERRKEFRILANGFDGCDLTDDEWRKSRRALVSLVRKKLRMSAQTISHLQKIGNTQHLHLQKSVVPLLPPSWTTIYEASFGFGTTRCLSKKPGRCWGLTIRR